MRVIAVVLAAGSSTRLGRPKQLVAHHGETLLHRAARIAREVADETVVVVPPGFGISDYVENPDAAEGMASSIRLGVSRATEERILLTVCDQPFVTADHLRALLAVDAPIVASGYRGIVGVPAAFAPRFIPELLALRGDRGARAVIEAHREDVRVVPFEDAGIDIDFPEDLGRLL
jgi:molybdenum cofactor cytidylyltransferase